MTTGSTLQNLTIKNNFLFGAVMLDENNSRTLLERILEFPIGKIEVDKEKSIVYHPEYKGVRLDVYAKDALNRRFNVEMQVLREPSPGKRSRYYHSQIDMELLLKGMAYEHLPDTYVIFICDYDPFGLGKYRYVFHNICVEDESAQLKDGSWTIFLNTHGTNDDEISEELLNVLKFVKATLEESQQDFNDTYIKQLQQSISLIKQNREMERRYMLLEELLKREYQSGKSEGKAEGIAEGKAESILNFLRKKSTISPELEEHIMKQSDLQLLDSWLDIAIDATSIEQFMKNIDFTI